MPSATENPSPAFSPTRWSVVQKAGQAGSMEGQKALSDLMEAYWPPLFRFIRRRSHTKEEAEDLTQGFFLLILEKNVVAQADRERGKFRTFLLSALTHYLANQHDYKNRLKRGGGAVILPLEFDRAGTRVVIDPADPRTPEAAFEQEWAETLLARVIDRLSREYSDAGKAALFQELKTYLVEDKGSVAYELACARLGVPLSTLKSAIHRLRRRYGEILRDEIAQTVDTPAEAEEELRHLLSVFSK